MRRLLLPPASRERRDERLLPPTLLLPISLYLPLMLRRLLSDHRWRLVDLLMMRGCVSTPRRSGLTVGHGSLGEGEASSPSGGARRTIPAGGVVM